jgi:hypothetical protein
MSLPEHIISKIFTYIDSPNSKLITDEIKQMYENYVFLNKCFELEYTSYSEFHENLLDIGFNIIYFKNRQVNKIKHKLTHLL